MNKDVKEVLTSQLWHIATMGDEPNVVPVGLKAVLDDDTLVIGDVFMVTTVENIKKNGKAAVSVCDPAGMSYQVKGSASYESEGPAVDALNAICEQKGFPFRARGAVIIKPERAIITSGGPDNKKEVSL